MRQRGAAARSADAGRKPRALRQLVSNGGDRFAIVLEFEFLSRKIASMQSMSRCRQKWRQSLAVGSSAAVLATIQGCPKRKFRLEANKLRRLGVQECRIAIARNLARRAT
jgi:hypothetical protein